MKNSALSAAALAALLAVAGPLAAADSITILSLTPPSGAFPAAPGFVTAKVGYEVQSSPWAQLAVFISQINPPPGMGQTSPGGSYTPTWVQKGKGTADVKFSLNCSATSVPGGAIVQVTAHLTQAQNAGGPLGIVTATSKKEQLRYTFTCGKPRPPQK
jgi:hypothetical protein